VSTLDPWYVENLICPVDGSALAFDAQTSRLRSAAGRTYPVVDGIPVMLPPDTDPTLAAVRASMHPEEDTAPWYLKSVLLSEEQKRSILDLVASGNTKVDPVAAHLVAATNGLGYIHLIGKLQEYPIPEIRLPDGNGKLLLDIGCSWGRWVAAAARKGYNAIGIDPSLGAVMAARRMTRELGLEARFIVGDARHLPLRAGLFDTVFSYSVIQHFSVADATRTFGHVGRVLKPGANCMIQMPAKYGARCLYNQARRGFRETKGFEVRYWTLRDLKRVFENKIGPVKFSVDCFFGIGWQASDARFMPASFRLIISASEFLRRISQWFPPLKQVADSVYVAAVKKA
jgi:SAM-dependent methyltransferase